MLGHMSEDDDRPSLEARVARLEWEVRQPRAELIRAQGTGSRPAPAAPITVDARFDVPAAARSAASPRRAVEERSSAIDLETLVGRYGMLGLATLLALAAIGTFVSWAVSRGLLGPTTRVALGLVAAAGIAAAGLKLRPRSRSFSDSLLALALAAVHVCAWAAGPSLGLVPAPLALAGSALVSVALGLLAALASQVLAYDRVAWMGRVGAAIAVGIAGAAWLVLLELSDGEPEGKLLDGLGDEDGPAAWIEGVLIPGLFVSALGIAL